MLIMLHHANRFSSSLPLISSLEGDSYRNSENTCFFTGGDLSNPDPPAVRFFSQLSTLHFEMDTENQRPRCPFWERFL